MNAGERTSFPAVSVTAASTSWVASTSSPRMIRWPHRDEARRFSMTSVSMTSKSPPTAGLRNLVSMRETMTR